MSDGPWADYAPQTQSPAATEHGPWENYISPAETEKQISVESGGNPKAVSKTGAQGLMQLEPGTARDMGVKDSFNAKQNVEGGQKYMHQLLEKYHGDKRTAYIAYNWGQGNVDKYGVEKAPASAKKYADDIMGLSTVGGLALNKLKSMASHTVNDSVAALSSIAAIPGMAVGLAGDAIVRGAKLLGGASWKEAAKKGHEEYEDVQAMAESYPNRIAELMHVVTGSKDYEKNDVNKVLGKLGTVLDKGADWVEKNVGVSKADSSDLFTLAQLTLGPKAIGKVASIPGKVAGAAGKMFKKGAEAVHEEPTLWGDEHEPTAATDAAKGEGAQPPIANKKQTNLPFATSVEEVAHQQNLRTQQTDMFMPEYERVMQLQEAAQKDAAVSHKTPVPGRSAEEDIAYAQKAAQDAGKMDTIKQKLGNSLNATYGKDTAMRSAFQRAESGKVDPNLMIGMGAIALGITGAVVDPDHPMLGGLLGLMAGIGIGKAVLSPHTAGATIAKLWKPDPRIRISDQMKSWDGDIASASRVVWQNQMAVVDKVPDKGRRAAATAWMQGDKTIPLTKSEHDAALVGRQFFDSLGQAGLSTDVLSNLIPDYVTNFWDLQGKNKGVWDKIVGGPGMSPQSVFNIQRKITSLAEGKKMGLVPVTEDLAEIMGMYGNSLNRTMANKKLIETLKTQLAPNSNIPLLVPEAAAPKAYISMDHPQLRGQRIHPDLEPSMKFLFDQRTPAGILAGLEGLNTALKRQEVSLSLFHAKALTDAYITSGGLPLKSPHAVIGMVAGTNKYLKQLRNGGAGDLPDRGLKAGLKLSFDMGAIADQDYGGSFYKGMETLGDALNPYIPGVAKLQEKYANVNHAVDTVMWSRLHAGMKLQVFAEKSELLMQNNIKANKADPVKYPLKTQAQVDEIAASFANNVFGGLNWMRAAEGAKTAWGRDLASTLYSSTGRRMMQFLMFAPDWNISTTRSFVKAYGQGTGARGLIKPQELSDLHRQYILRNSLYYLTVGNALNMAFTGKPIWENKDPTMIDLGDGRKMPFSKHATDPIRMATHPAQEALSKMGAVPSEAMEQLTGKEYLSASGHSPPMDTSAQGRLSHALKRAVPFQLESPSVGAAISGTVGFPIYGKSTKQQAEELKEKREKERNKILHGQGSTAGPEVYGSRG